MQFADIDCIVEKEWKPGYPCAVSSEIGCDGDGLGGLQELDETLAYISYQDEGKEEKRRTIC